jgi:hypothetical protein
MKGALNGAPFVLYKLVTDFITVLIGVVISRLGQPPACLLLN